MTIMARIGIIGLGNWGTTLAYIWCRDGHNVLGWTVENDVYESMMISKENKNYIEVLNINSEFKRRVNKRKMMNKKPMKTSLSGLNQTEEWLNLNSFLKDKVDENLKNGDISKDKTSKIRNKNLREPTDINKKNTLW